MCLTCAFDLSVFSSIFKYRERIWLRMILFSFLCWKYSQKERSVSALQQEKEGSWDAPPRGSLCSVKQDDDEEAAAHLLGWAAPQDQFVVLYKAP